MFNDKFFLNKWDAFLYLCLSIIFPSFSFVLQYEDTSVDEPHMVFSFIVAGLIFLITFYYDFYTRYEEAENISSSVFNYYRFGVLLYAGLFVVSILFSILFGMGKISSSNIVNGFFLIFFTSLYPLCMPVCYFTFCFKQDKIKKVKRFKV